MGSMRTGVTDILSDSGEIIWTHFASTRGSKNTSKIKKAYLSSYYKCVALSIKDFWFCDIQTFNKNYFGTSKIPQGKVNKK